MESVEELCEYITLLHQAEKILDGKLSDIKKAYKNNMYQVVLETKNDTDLTPWLNDTFEISSVKFDNTENQLSFTVHLPKADTSTFLSTLSSRATISNFVETVPTANDIFIRTVQSMGVYE